MNHRRLALIATLCVAVILTVPAAATVHVVQQVGITFVPDDITITQGDTVRWVHGGQSHTVTSGTGAADPQVGALFDAPLDLAHPLFEFVFADAGDVPYFCRPHELMGMTGIVRVQADPNVGVDDDVVGAGPMLLSPYPNPFNPRTTIAFALDAATSVRLRIYSLDGRSVRVVHQGALSAGVHQMAWNGRDDAGKPVAAGSYVVRLETPDGARSRTITLVK